MRQVRKKQLFHDRKNPMDIYDDIGLIANCRFNRESSQYKERPVLNYHDV